MSKKTPEERKAELLKLVEAFDGDDPDFAEIYSAALVGYCIGLGETRSVFLDRMRLAYDKRRQELFSEFNDASFEPLEPVEAVDP